MTVMRAVVGALEILTGLSVLWGEVIATFFMVGLHAFDPKAFVGVISGFVFIAAGVLCFVYWNQRNMKAELIGLGLLVLVFIAGLVFHGSYRDLSIQAGVAALLTAVLIAVKYNQRRVKV